MVRRATVAGEDSKVGVIMDLPLPDSASQQSEGLAIDWISRTIYYVSMDQDRDEGSCIYAARLDGTGVARVLCTSGIVRGLLVLPTFGLMAWHEIVAERGTEVVQVSSMDGTHVRMVHSLQRTANMIPAISCLTSNSENGKPSILG